MKQIATRFQEGDIKSRRSKFRSNTISYILKNPVYYGVYLVNKYEYKYDSRTGHHRRTKKEKSPSEVINFPAPAVIPKSRWDAIQERVKFNKSKTRRKTKDDVPVSWLRNVLVCEECRAKVSAYVGRVRATDGGRHRYYTCHWAKSGKAELKYEGRKKCRLPRIQADEIEKVLWNVIMSRFNLNRKSRIKKALEVSKDQSDRLNATARNLSRRQQKLANERDNIYKLLENEHFDKDELSQRLQENRNNTRDVEGKLVEVNRRIEEQDEQKRNAKMIRELLNHENELAQISKELKDLPSEVKQQFVEVVSPRIRIGINRKGEKYGAKFKGRTWKYNRFPRRINTEILQRLAQDNHLPTLKKLIDTGILTHKQSLPIAPIQAV